MKQSVEEIANSIISHLSNLGVKDAETTRRALGLTLSSIHSVILAEAAGKTSDSEREAVRSCFDTIQRLAQTLGNDATRFGISGVVIETGIRSAEDEQKGPIQ